MRILLWHVHGGWTDAFVRGDHEYILPITPNRDRWGLGRAERPWPQNVVEVPTGDLAGADVDIVVLQRLEELEMAEVLLGRRLGVDVAAVFVEHNTPRAGVPESRHPLADRADLLLAHVTHFNELFWDTGTTPTVVVDHGVVDPGPLYQGDLERLGVVMNDPVRRWRVTGTDLLPAFAAAGPLDVFGMNTVGVPEATRLGHEDVTVVGDLPTSALHARLARCRAYVHPMRWTSLGLSLIEAMHLGMPVVALATTEALRAVPAGAGAISTDVEVLVARARTYLADPDRARADGLVARDHALRHYGLQRFLNDWDVVLTALRDGLLPADVAAVVRDRSTEPRERIRA